jgi:Na+-transporting methylmalonyl-CoA/oxaloacetate decarboxylase gamma subunit
MILNGFLFTIGVALALLVIGFVIIVINTVGNLMDKKASEK